MSHIVHWNTDRDTAITGKSIMQSPTQSRNAAIAGVELSSKVDVKSSRNEDTSLKLQVKDKFCSSITSNGKEWFGKETVEGHYHSWRQAGVP